MYAQTTHIGVLDKHFKGRYKKGVCGFLYHSCTGVSHRFKAILTTPLKPLPHEYAKTLPLKHATVGPFGRRPCNIGRLSTAANRMRG